MIKAFAILLGLLLAASADAQQRPVFDADDFVDPRQHREPVFIPRLTVGAAKNLIDDYRATGQDAGFVFLANSVYWKNWQFDYKHAEVRGKNDSSAVTRCDCKPPLYFPTPPPPDTTPDPPRPGSRDTLQIGFYRRAGGGAGELPVLLRYRLSFSRQHIGTVIRSAETDAVVDRRSGHEQSAGVDADTHFRWRGRDVWGSLLYARTSRSGTVDDRRQQELAYTARPPGWLVGPLLTRATLTVGGVSNRGGTALNVINPALEAFWHSPGTGANVHLVWSPQATRDGAAGWRMRHQLALFVDRPLFVMLLRRGATR